MLRSTRAQSVLALVPASLYLARELMDVLPAGELFSEFTDRSIAAVNTGNHLAGSWTCAVWIARATLASSSAALLKGPG